MVLRFGTLLCFLGCISSTLGEPVVKLDVGSVRGTEMKSEASGKVFYAFRGIPYAEPPIGKLRFKPPVAKRSWGDDILDATQDGAWCPQTEFGTNTFVGQEDNCLILNVYTGQVSNDKLRPVMVYFHGGGFVFGTGSSEHYGPKRLLDNAIVLVTLNYRVGTLGFLSTGDSESPGNYGLLDQVEALKWVKSHVKHFGGDADRVTIFGTSAGGASVTYHMLSPLSKGLFQRAIALSGSALGSWAYQPDPLPWARKVGAEVGCPVHDNEKMMECLRHVPAKNLTESGVSFNVAFLPLTMVPTVDKYFLPDAPINLLQKGMINEGVEFMTGITKDEASCLYAYLLQKRGKRPLAEKKDVKRYFEDVVGTNLHNHKAVDLMYSEYLENLDIEDTDATRKVYTKVSGDGCFDIPHYQTALLMAEAGVKTYAFRYDYEAQFSLNYLFGQKTQGVSHLDDVFMLFHGEVFDHATFGEKDEKIKHIYQSLLINFAKHGNPVPELTDNVPVEWNLAQPNKLWVYHIDDPLSCAVYEPENDPSFEFWTKKIPEALRESKIKPKEKSKGEL